MTQRDHAVVIGASVAGLLAARVLSNHFERVTVLERDELPAEPASRRCVPQGNHIHVLLAGGERALERMFPGFGADLEEKGAQRINPGVDSAWYHFGVWKLRIPTDFLVHLQSRPLIEWVLRRRVEALDRVELRTGESVSDIRSDRGRVMGVALSDGTELDAELVVDASGRGSTVERTLAEVGSEPVPSSEVEVDLTYVSRRYRLAKSVDWKVLVIFPEPPEKRGGAVLLLEDGTFIVTLIGWCSERAKTTEEGFLEYAKSLPHPYLGELLQDAEPVSKITQHRYPKAKRRHFEKLKSPPVGLVVLGDALCSFDPVFGQGMTTAALVAEALDEALARSSDDSKLPGQFYRRAANVTDVPWMMSTGEDFRYPEVVGARPPGLWMSHWYTEKLHRATATDPAVLKAFLQAMHMLEPPTVVLAPRVIWGALRSSTGNESTAHPPKPHRSVP